ncbi:MAG: MBL fold metallo-hydrolase [Desulfosudaceae bacterium]
MRRSATRKNRKSAAGGPVLSRQMAAGIHRITLPLPGNKPGPVNVYLFIGTDHIALLDAGTARGFDTLCRALAELGLACEDIDRILLTHSHIDHYGAVKKILRASRSPIEVAGNFEKTASIATGLGVSRRTMGDFLALMGVPPLVRTAMRTLSSAFSLLGEKCRVSHRVGEGAEVRMGDYRLRVLETPGHTIDSICLFDDRTGMLFSGDHVLPHITPNAFVMLEEGRPLPSRLSQQEFYDSLEKVSRLNPRIIYPAHGQPITDFPSIRDMYVDNFTERENRILEILGDAEMSVYALARRLFPNLNTARLPLEIFLAVSEVYTHVQVLEDKGQVQIGTGGGGLVIRRR